MLMGPLGIMPDHCGVGLTDSIQVVYFGDHLYSDIVAARASPGWLGAAVVEECESDDELASASARADVVLEARQTSAGDGWREQEADRAGGRAGVLRSKSHFGDFFVSSSTNVTSSHAAATLLREASIVIPCLSVLGQLDEDRAQLGSQSRSAGPVFLPSIPRSVSRMMVPQHGGMPDAPSASP